MPSFGNKIKTIKSILGLSIVIINSLAEVKISKRIIVSKDNTNKINKENETIKNPFVLKTRPTKNILGFKKEDIIKEFQS